MKTGNEALDVVLSILRRVKAGSKRVEAGEADRPHWRQFTHCVQLAVADYIRTELLLEQQRRTYPEERRPL